MQPPKCLVYECAEAPAKLRFMAKFIVRDHGRMRIDPIVFYASTAKGAKDSALAWWAAELAKYQRAAGKSAAARARAAKAKGIAA